MSLYDPLLEFENSIQNRKNTHTKHPKITLSRAKVFFTTREKTPFSHLLSHIQFLGTYALLSGCIFAIMMGAMNFNAYSARLMHWINPHAYAESSADIATIISAGTEQIVMGNSPENRDSRAIIEEKIALNNPEIVYSRSYSEESLLANIPLTSAETASFRVTPHENRVIIPKLGKNIPLLDTHHDEGTSFTEMHEVFMEELKKGIVRYPGTAKPGEAGNAFIFGHSSNYPWIQSDYNDVFALLDTLKDGDEIIVYYEQKKYTYRVSDRAVVKPGDTQVMAARDPNKKEISLMTCWPIGTTLERLIIFGELVENNS